MKSAEYIKEYFQKSMLSTNPDRHEAVFEKIQRAQDQSKITAPALSGFNRRSKIMKSPITKLAATAAVIAIAVLGLFEFIGTDAGSGVVWAEVARKVQASRGVIFRSKDIYQDWRDDAPDYTMNYFSNTHARLDSYKGDQIIQTIYDDFNTKTVILVDHLPSHKSYVKMTFEQMNQHRLNNPKSMIQRFLSCEHRELGQKIVEGVLCEGIETTDPAFDGSGPDYPTDSVIARIWVSVETGYPVQLENEIVRNNGEIRIGGVSDQFQWDVELDERMFEPEIPADYIDISP